MSAEIDSHYMDLAVAQAEAVRRYTAPNPWVGCVIVCRNGDIHTGATEPPGGRHAEIVALDGAQRAGADLTGATLYSTLEPCSHHGRTGPCTEAILRTPITRVVIGTMDPDVQVAGSGAAALRAAGLSVDVGIEASTVQQQLRPYLHHRRTGRPLVVLKMAATLDGRIAAADGSSQWITGEAARRRVHELRADSQAVCTGAGTIRADDPELTVRHVSGPDPRRVVLGRAPEGARVRPCLEWDGPLPELLDRLGSEGVLQLLVEAGPTVAGSFHRERLVDQYVLHLAPALAGSECPGLLAQSTTLTIAELWRGRITHTSMLGPDLEVILEPLAPDGP